MTVATSSDVSSVYYHSYAVLLWRGMGGNSIEEILKRRKYKVKCNDVKFKSGEEKCRDNL